MQFCYVLSCDGFGEHAEMLCVSANTLRRWHRDAEVVVLCDEETNTKLGMSRERITSCASRIKVVGSVQGEARERSRAIKTTMRRYLDGPFVFLDLDTIVLGELSELQEARHELSIAYDYETGVVDERDRELYERLDSAAFPVRAFNSGVMGVEDTPNVREFFEEWHRRWLRCRALGRIDDQPSLNSTIAAQSIGIDVLEPRYNAMILYFPHRFRSCRVAHFLASTKMWRTLMTDLLESFRATGNIDWDAIEISVRGRHPWGRHPEPWQLARSGNYLQAAALKVKRVLCAGDTQT